MIRGKKKQTSVKHQYQVASPGGRSLSPGVIFMGTRSETQLPQSRAGGQGPYLRSLDHLGRNSEAIDRKNLKKVKCDRRTNGQTDGPTDGPTKRGVESRGTRD